MHLDSKNYEKHHIFSGPSLKKTPHVWLILNSVKLNIGRKITGLEVMTLDREKI